jgi:hypothetical protein
MKRSALVAAALTLLLVAMVAESKADLISDHALTEVTGQVPGVPGFNTSFSEHLGSSSSDGASSSGGGASQFVNCLAQALVSGGQFSLTSSVSASASLSLSNPQAGASQASGNASAQWQDVLFLGSTDTSVLGHTLRLTFGSVGGGTIADSGLGSGGGGYDAEKAVTVADFVNSRSVNPLFTSSGGPTPNTGWDSFTGDASNYRGTYHVDISINPSTGAFGIPGAFYFDIQSIDGATARAGNLGTSESVSSFDPTQSLSVTLPDIGNVTPESLGVSVTFDSGILSPNLTAVPEPSSFVLARIGAAGLLAYGCRRRKTASREIGVSASSHSGFRKMRRR